MGRPLLAALAVAVALLCLVQAPAGQPTRAQEVPKVADARPFVETLKPEEARALISKAAKGDAEAIAMIEDCRLALVALIATHSLVCDE